jgi:cathepsin L
VEGQHRRASGQLVSLSEQNLIDCSRDYGTRGCKGGWVDSAFEYIKQNKGIDVEFYYRYHATEQRCMYFDLSRGATITGYVDLKKGDENELKIAVATQGPVSVIIDASQQSFKVVLFLIN